MEKLGQFWRERIGARDRRPTWEWAKDKVILVPPFTKTGPFDVTTSRHLIDPLDCLDDERVREENIMGPVRGGKTMAVDVFSMSVISRTPGPFMWIFQEDKAASDQAELRTWPLILANEHIRRLLPEDRHKRRGQEIIFPAMPFHIKGPAMSNLQSRGWQYVVLDEPWLYKPGRIEEARGRLGDYVRMGTDKFICISQAGVDGDDWDRQFHRGIIHDWHVECLKCDHYMAPKWTGKRQDGSRWGMRWNIYKLPNGLWDVPKVLPTVRFECEKCGEPHIDGTRTKTEWNRTGKYVAEQTDKSPKRRSHHWNAIIDFPWESLVEMYLNAINAWKLGVPEPLIQFFQKYMAEPKSERLLLEEGQKFRSSGTYEITSDWPDEFVRILTADRQAEDVYWVAIRAWAKDGRSRRLWFGKLYSAGEIEAKRQEFKVDANHTLVDSGYKPKGDHGVYADCIRYGWIPVKGVATEGGEPVTFKHRMPNGKVIERSYSEPVWVDPEIGTALENRQQVQMIRFSSPTYADRLQNLIDRGLWEEPDLDETDPVEVEYRRQMGSEYKKPKRDKFTGKTKLIWVCPSGNNHAFDCGKEQVLAATLMDILPDLDVTEMRAAA